MGPDERLPHRGAVMPRPSSRGWADGTLTLLALAALLAWDASGWDLTVVRWAGSGAGFVWRDSWWASRLLHDGGRWAAWLLLAALMVAALRAPPAAATRPGDGPSRAERWRWIAVMLAAVLAVPALKRVSSTSCPWDLAEFGGVAAYVSHWHPGVLDGGPGHCFPSGHAVAAFAFFGLYFMWREYDPRRAHAWLAVVGVVGLAFGVVQGLRGAHYPSHTLWSAWLCWAINAVAARAPLGVGPSDVGLDVRRRVPHVQRQAQGGHVIGIATQDDLR
ncbi:MAG: phosphatase PAP2 family protein [Rubrivivax sp.]|nr:phosphatase PAP2 family protein [Rubrivivax sp.]